MPDTPSQLPHPPRDHEQPANADAMLIGFLRHRDVACPRCAYNLRNAPQAACPECGDRLRLSVNLERPIIGAFLATIGPGLGCGVCSLIFIMLIMTHGDAPPQIVVFTLLMLVSGMFALVIIAVRRHFMRQARERQWAWAVISIVIHSVLIILFGISLD